MAKSKRHSKYKVTTIKLKNTKTPLGLAIVGLILNILTVAGLGSLINSRIKVGIGQMILFFVGAIGMYFYYTAFGILVLISWIWGLITGIRMIQQSR